MSKATPAVLLLLACDGLTDATDGPPGIGELEATVEVSSEIGTVMTVRWGTPSAGTTAVEWGLDETYGTVVKVAGERGDHAVAVAGLPPGTTIHWRAVSEVDGEPFTTPDMQTETGSAPNSLPDLQVEAQFATAYGQSPFLTSTIGTSQTVLLYDRTGRPTWWQYADDDKSISDAKLSKDKTSILWSVQPEDRISNTSFLRRVSWDGITVEDTQLPDGHHDFVELPDGSYGFCMLDVREFEGESIVGDAIAEIPRAGDPATDLRVVWTSWDDLPVRVDAETDIRFYPQGLDWVHCNGLIYDEDEGAYYMSAHELSAIFKVDRASGDLLWAFGGEDNQFTLTDGTWFVAAHSPELTEDGIRLLDNGPLGTDPGYSRAVEYELDETNFTAKEVWSYDANQAYYSFVLGDVEAMPDGNLQLSWGSTGTYEQASLDGESLWVGSLDLGNLAGFAHPLSQMGGPSGL